MASPIGQIINNLQHVQKELSKMILEIDEVEDSVTTQKNTQDKSDVKEEKNKK